MDILDAIKLWKENKVCYVNFEFSCGGDSMGDTNFQIYDEEGTEIHCAELVDYFEEEIYRKVSFYENSDGHYQGEAGNVEIRLNEEEDDFDYSKSSQSEWCETINNYIEIKLEEKEIELIKSKILNINGGEGDVQTNYKADCILTDEEVELIDKIEQKIADECSSYSPETQFEVHEWFRFTTNEENEEIKIKRNKIVVEVSNQVTEYRDEWDE